MHQNIQDLISQLENSTLSSDCLPLNKEQFINISKSLEHYSAGLAIGKKEKSGVAVEEKTKEINKLLNLLVYEVGRVSGPTLKKRYSAMLLDLLIAFQNLMKADDDINSLTGAVW